MEVPEMNDNRWVEDRLATLEPTREFQPDADQGLVRVRARRRARTLRRKLYVWSTAGFTLLATGILVSPECKAAGCSVPARDYAKTLWQTVFHGNPSADP